MEAPAAEQILVCLSPSPSNEKVVLAADKMARVYQAELTALYVEPMDGISPEDRKRLERNSALAKSCGARVVNVSGGSVVEQIALYVTAAQVKKIVIGRPAAERRRGLRGADIVQQLLQLVPTLEVFIIPDNQARPPRERQRPRRRLSVRFTLIALSLLTAATAIGLLLWQWRFPAASIIPVYILSVLLCAYFTEGPAYGIAVSVLSVLVFNFFFTDPRFTFRAYDSSYPLTFFVMLAVAMLTGSLTTKVKTQARANARKAYRTEVLLTASQNLQTAENDGDIISETGRQLHKLLGRPILVASVTDGAPDKPLLVTDAPDDSPSPRAVEGLRCVLTGEAGAPAAVRGEDGLYFPIRGHGRVRVVVGVLLNPGENIDEFDRSLLLALLGECGAALEKHRLWQAKQSLAVAAEQEKLRANLLRSISHDLRTPLTTISGNADMLMNGSVVLSDAQRQSLYENIYDDSTWLISLVENLLSITRMDDAALKLNLRPELVGDVLDEAVSHVIRRSGGRTVRVEAGSELLFARMDAPLINQVLVNLLNNAIKYTPEGSVITASAREEGDLVWISVADNGLGVPREAQAHVFEMFYTGEKLRGDDRRGLGLGLALCRAIVEAHGGQITVGDAKPHGAVFSFSLKREEADFNDKAPGADR